MYNCTCKEWWISDSIRIRTRCEMWVHISVVECWLFHSNDFIFEHAFIIKSILSNGNIFCGKMYPTLLFYCSQYKIHQHDWFLATTIKIQIQSNISTCCARKSQIDKFLQIFNVLTLIFFVGSIAMSRDILLSWLAVFLALLLSEVSDYFDFQCLSDPGEDKWSA